jgi:hypothetical protein
MNEKILQNLQEYGTQVIAFFGKLNPIVGGVVTLLLGSLIAWFGFKVKRQKNDEQVRDSGESIGAQTGKDQSTVGAVQDKLDDFFKK